LAKGDFDGAERLMKEIPLQFVAAPFLTILGHYHGQHGRWQPALTNFSRAIIVASQTNSGAHDLLPNAYHASAPLFVQTGDVEGYRQHCSQILREFTDTTNCLAAERLAKDCLILPPPAEALPAIGRMVNTAVAAGPKHQNWPYFQFVKGLFEYRQGHYAEAIDWLQQVTPAQENDALAVHAYMVLAMAQHQLNQEQPARATLAEGLRVAQKLPKTLDGQATAQLGPASTPSQLRNSQNELKYR
jgi:tetratricopeptide (TPR) repeat protein